MKIKAILALIYLSLTLTSAFSAELVREHISDIGKDSYFIANEDIYFSANSQSKNLSEPWSDTYCRLTLKNVSSSTRVLRERSKLVVESVNEYIRSVPYLEPIKFARTTEIILQGEIFDKIICDSQVGIQSIPIFDLEMALLNNNFWFVYSEAIEF